MKTAKSIIEDAFYECNAHQDHTGKLADALLRSLARAGLEITPGWSSDMKAAPRDGTEILIAKYHDRAWGWVVGVGYWEDVTGIYGWVPTYGLSNAGVLGLGQPTHWKPNPRSSLPLPPSPFPL